VVPVNLLAIVAFQAVILGLAMLAARKSAVRVQVSWTIAIATGAGVGFLMDAVLSAYGIFAYLPDGPLSSPRMSRDLSLFLLAFNAFASYGLAAATAALMSECVVSVRLPLDPRWSLRLSTLPLVGTVAVALSPPSSIPMMVAWGLVLVGVGEVALSIGGRVGPLLAILSQSDWRPALRFAVFAATIGVLYELCNFYYPFWVWLPNGTASPDVVRVLIPSLGYIALRRRVQCAAGRLVL
jgi:hypothetical protein